MDKDKELLPDFTKNDPIEEIYSGSPVAEPRAIPLPSIYLFGARPCEPPKSSGITLGTSIPAAALE
jgi:hypothetical protein